MDYPLWQPELGGGVLIGIIAIAHVLVAHFAIGGGLALALLETIGVRRRDRAFLDLARRGSGMLILVSTVFGAVSGVGIWIVIGLVHPAATSSLIRLFVWAWAIEWVFFIAEIATALAYFATWDRVQPQAHLRLIWFYFVAAYLSLVVIQGILAFMLTPGEWLREPTLANAFFNPTYLPGMALRTGICLFLAGAYLALAALRERDPAARGRLVRVLGALQITGILVAYGGYRWWEAALPESVRGLFLGAPPALAALGATRRFLLASLAVYLGLAVLQWLWRGAARWPVAVAALLAAFAFFGGYERLREGCRKPFVIRGYMFSNGVRLSEIASLDERGILSQAPWARAEADGAHAEGRAVFRALCRSCHTVEGYLGIRKFVAGLDADMVLGVLYAMQEDGRSWAEGRLENGERVPARPLQYPYMAPFTGTEEEMLALAEYLAALGAEAGDDR